MKMNIRIITMLLVAVAYMIASAQPKPRWVQKGVKAMKNERSKKSYGFHKFYSYGADLNELEPEWLKPLMEYVSKPMSVKF